MDLKFVVDENRCIGCEECINECPFGLLALVDQTPAISPENETQCIRCQHCMVVCPNSALSIMGFDPGEAVSALGTFPDAGKMAALIKGRRSVRRYHQRPVSKETISFLLETALFAPTAINNRQVTFTVVEDPQIMEKVRRATYDILEKKRAQGGLPKGMEYVEQRMAEGNGMEKDFIFRNAPHLLVASSPKQGFSPEVDCLIALSYFELLAASKGIGSLWCGLAKSILTMLAPEILEELGVPSSHKVGYIMVFGEPDVQYHRSIQLGKPRINRARVFDL